MRLPYPSGRPGVPDVSGKTCGRKGIFPSCMGMRHGPAIMMMLAMTPFIALQAEEPASAPAARFEIAAFGAVGDGKTLNTRAIQAAIDACAAGGGGWVVIAGGSFLTGTLYLKDRVVLHVAEGATLLGSTDIAEYATDTHKNMYRGEPHMDRCLIFARNAKGIGIEGKGVIDGQGAREKFPNPGDPRKNRPMLIRFLECSDIRMRDITLRNPASWTSAWLYCDRIEVSGITISSRVNSNGDGLNFDGCREVRVSDSRFDTSDDSICLQTSRPDRPCRDVVITNCVFRSHWAGMRIGLLSRGDIEDVTVSHCTFTDISDSGLKIQMNEGGAMRKMVFENLTMTNVPRPVFMTLAQVRACVDAPEEVPPVGTMQGFIFRDMAINTGGGRDSAIILSGLPGHPIRDVTFTGIRITTGGGGTFEQGEVRSLAAFPKAGWPEYNKLKGTVPAHGFYARHVKGLSLRRVEMNVRAADARPGVVLDDVSDVSLEELTFAPTQAAALMRFQQVRGATIRDGHSVEGAAPLVRIEGGATERIHVGRGKIAVARPLVLRGDEVKESAVMTDE